jgi:3-oxoadipate enol-lactonase
MLPRLLPTMAVPGVEIPAGRAVELPGRGVTFVREMAGPPGAPTVVLLHGLGATAGTNFAACFTALAQHFRVVALDQRGHGRGVRASERFSLAACADDAAALADVLRIERFTPVGYSMGGAVAQLLWRRHRHRVDGLVLCATSRDFRGHWRERVRFHGIGVVVSALNVIPRRAVTELQAILPADACDGDRRWFLDELRRSDPRSILEATEAIGRFTSREWIADVDVPVSTVIPAGDRTVPVRRQAKLALAIPTAVLHVMQGDHLACSSAADEFRETLVDACRLVHHRIEGWAEAA